MRLGAFFTDAEVDAATPVCVLGQTVVDNLFGSEDPISLQTTLGSASRRTTIGSFCDRAQNGATLEEWRPTSPIRWFKPWLRV
jgi:hypothetical protein